MNRNVCRHWNGRENDTCGAGVDWREVFENAARCIGNSELKCDKYSTFTDEEWKEIQRKEKETTEEFAKMMKTKLSSCCCAPIDESRVIRTGRHKGHGGRYCSKCKKCLYFV